MLILCKTHLRMMLHPIESIGSLLVSHSNTFGVIFLINQSEIDHYVHRDDEDLFILMMMMKIPWWWQSFDWSINGFPSSKGFSTSLIGFIGVEIGHELRSSFGKSLNAMLLLFSSIFLNFPHLDNTTASLTAIVIIFLIVFIVFNVSFIKIFSNVLWVCVQLGIL